MDEWYGGFSKIESTDDKLKEHRQFERKPQSPCDCYTSVGHICEKHKEPAPEWRDLGEDEVICMGDETMSWGSQEWFTPCGDYYLGRPAHAFRPNRFRTRRPLPKQEEMPLEDEIKQIETTDEWPV